MKIRIKPSTGEQLFVYVDVNRTEMVENARKAVASAYEEASGKSTSIDQFSLIYQGKQLADGMRLFDYGVKHGDTFLLHLRAPIEMPASTPDNSTLEAGDSSSGSVASVSLSESPSGETVANDGAENESEEPVKCDHCDNGPTSHCNYCGCYYCGMKDDEHHTLACDECGRFYHMRCLPEPLTTVPEGDWYCEFCKTDLSNAVIGEQKLDLTNSRKSKMPSAKQKKAWGGGMACAGTTKTCTIVPKDHAGSIPGVHVGQSWKYRIHVSESGIHRPPVGGIAGSSTKPAVSIVLAGGYPEDVDKGDEFVYTGSGGYDLSGNKRQAKVQTFDQELTRQNRSLAMACAAPVNDQKGAVAKDWRASSPIRVCRSYKAAKMHPEYAPTEGVRYDGLYRIVKYWKEKGVSGFCVWRYLFRRDDPEPAPWTEEGKKHIEELGLTLYNPDTTCDGRTGLAKGSPSKSSLKRKADDDDDSAASKARRFQPGPELQELIRLDKENSRLWANMSESEYATESGYLEALAEGHLGCPICQELVQKPVTTPCGHNICNPCLCKSMDQYGVICPICRSDIASMGSIADLKLQMNQNLVTILKALIPSYGKEWMTPPKITETQYGLRSGAAVKK
ncbi:hypothetical protein H4R20_005577 [Coemansia guatemalensis]|uniref:RING-type E3 ubiquitin transferase n=1 Tax=Coemansia guatemalensis TaxID=2761395 RepID=A0A9W8HPC6_9FUNG|nr:hypothetical protein H4R20_005577 [Coemansia guatemalensis]